MRQQKTEYRNDSAGIIGVITIELGGERTPIPVGPGKTVWLSEEEEIATANAPQRDEDNPFINGHLAKVTDAADILNRRPIGANASSPESAEQKRKAEEQAAAVKAANERQAAEEQARLKEAQQQATAPQPNQAPPRQTRDETAAPPQSQGSQAKGSRAAGEEVGTPEAAAKG